MASNPDLLSVASAGAKAASPILPYASLVALVLEGTQALKDSGVLDSKAGFLEDANFVLGELHKLANHPALDPVARLQIHKAMLERRMLLAEELENARWASEIDAERKRIEALKSKL